MVGVGGECRQDEEIEYEEPDLVGCLDAREEGFLESVVALCHNLGHPPFAAPIPLPGPVARQRHQRGAAAARRGLPLRRARPVPRHVRTHGRQPAGRGGEAGGRCEAGGGAGGTRAKLSEACIGGLTACVKRCCCGCSQHKAQRCIGFSDAGSVGGFVETWATTAEAASCCSRMVESKREDGREADEGVRRDATLVRLSWKAQPQ